MRIENVFLFKGPKMQTFPGLRPGRDGVVQPGIRYTATTDESQVPPRPHRGMGRIAISPEQVTQHYRKGGSPSGGGGASKSEFLVRLIF